MSGLRRQQRRLFTCVLRLLRNQGSDGLCGSSGTGDLFRNRIGLPHHAAYRMPDSKQARRRPLGGIQHGTAIGGSVDAEAGGMNMHQSASQYIADQRIVNLAPVEFISLGIDHTVDLHAVHLLRAAVAPIDFNLAIVQGAYSDDAAALLLVTSTSDDLFEFVS